MKKTLNGIIAMLLIFCGGGYSLYKISCGGTKYYVQVKNNANKQGTKDDNDGNPFIQYTYTLEAFNSKGNDKEIKFDSSRNLKYGSYLELTYNKEKGVTNIEEIQKSKLPKEALKKFKIGTI